MRPWVARLLDLLAPETCRLCRPAATHAAPWVCPACIEASPPPPPPICARCARSHADHDRGCGPVVRAATPYHAPTGVPAAVAVRMLKFDGRRALARPLAALVHGRVPLPRRALLVPVPLAPGRLRARGYNQAALLARHLAGLTGLPLDPDLLVRTADRPPQASLDRHARLRNLHGTVVARGVCPSWRGMILIDDVATTGATLRTCADALRAAGARRVDAVVVARRTLLSGRPPTR